MFVHRRERFKESDDITNCFCGSDTPSCHETWFSLPVQLVCKDCCLLLCDAMKYSIIVPMLQRILLPLPIPEESVILNHRYRVLISP